ncbi:MAG: HAD hydrolase-like protein [Firmicutes bacterium]|nr:HAD hydrolase-like protein [Bacillota bacterium]
MNTKEVFLFDLDGTLTDSAPGVTRCVQYALEDQGIHVEDTNDLLCFVGPPLQDSFRDFYGLTGEANARAGQKYRERYGKIGYLENSVYDGIKELLEDLKAHGKKVCVATSKGQQIAKKVLDHFELMPYLDVLCGSQEGRDDSKIDVMRMALEKAEVSDYADAVMIGDRHFDIDASKALGLESVGVYYGGCAEEGELEKAGADKIVRTVKELHEFLISL